MNKSSIKALLFDLGGVVLEVDFTKVFHSLASISALDAKEIKHQFSMDWHYQQHERGGIEASEFFQHLRHTLQLTATDDEIAQAWNDIFGRQMTASLDAIDTISNEIPCYGFSNTNRTHQTYWEYHYPRIPTTFVKLFVSSEIGLRKPDASAFEFVLREMSVEPEEVLFFDDTQENIDGAKRLGIQTILVTGADTVVNTIRDLNSLSEAKR
ncbi:MAG: HAD family hydrolase [Granulosicoccus sp.]